MSDAGKIGVILCGACGRMGRIASEFIEKSADFSLSAGVDPVCCDAGGVFFRSIFDVVKKADVIIDFSVHTAAESVSAYAAERALPLVVGTTGHTNEEISFFHEAARRVPVFISSNMSVGMSLVARFAATAAGAMDGSDVAVVETHRRGKLDKPSGTAKDLAEMIEKSCGRTAEIHSVRIGDVPGEHEIIIANECETITLRHTANKRSLFAAGALRAARFIVGKAPGLYGMDSFFDTGGKF